MATAPPAPIQWIPEDDLLLKNAVEAGASLEALAKGAVQFSRRFTFQELRDRWHSLLYDPDISAQASSHIFELEISGIINPSSKIKGNKEASQKRKSESIRRKYYAMRKKFRSEFFNNPDLAFFEPSPHDFNGHGGDYQKKAGNNTLGPIGDSISDHLGLQEEDLDILRHAFPETMGDMTATTSANAFEDNCPIRSNTFEANVRNGKNLRTIKSNENLPSSSVGFQDDGQFNSPNSDGFGPFHMFGPDPGSYTGEFADPDSLLNLSNEDEILLMDFDEKHPEDKSCLDNNVSSPLLDSIREDNKENDIEPTVSETLAGCLEVGPTVSETRTNVGVLEVSVREDREINLQSEASGPSKPSSGFDFTDGKICCTLNTEDTEIPCNDDIFLLIHPSTSFGSSATQPNSVNASSHEKINERENLQTKLNDNSTRSSLRPQKLGMIQGVPESLSSKTDSRPHPTVPAVANRTVGDSGKGKSLPAIPKLSNSKLNEKDVSTRVGDSPAAVMRSAEVGSGRIVPLEPVVNSSVSDGEESTLDDDVPYFSDIEAMILEMDLDPLDQDSQGIRQVPSYQYDDTKKTIIRLEQAARSCLERAMTSQGALAILYGRHLRHYIRKPEVLLGRSTDDVDVDIDLRKEGRANKISRRQAIIKMEPDGSFFLKNLGKSSVSVNGVTVGSGQSLALCSSCLIEIKGMSFVFEANQRYARKQLRNFCLKNKGKAGKSEQSPDNDR